MTWTGGHYDRLQGVKSSQLLPCLREEPALDDDQIPDSDDDHPVGDLPVDGQADQDLNVDEVALEPIL